MNLNFVILGSYNAIVYIRGHFWIDMLLFDYRFVIDSIIVLICYSYIGYGRGYGV
jgi:hypothetical protein